MKALFKDTVIAESDDTVVVENTHYFPRESVKMEYLEKSGNSYTCHWKGDCDYYNVKVGDDVESDAAFIYEAPSEKAQEVKGRVAFWRGVRVEY
jgi:uncharacterized protein (DUF427 family)